MYIKLTRLDGTPIWINAAFVVTVEPRKLGGTIVVPIGDGLDYEIREKTDQVLEMLGEAPAATVVPVPVPKSLTPTPDDVSPDVTPEPIAEESEEVKPTRRTVAPSGKAKAATAHKTRAKAAAKKNASPEKKSSSAELTEAQLDQIKRMAPGSLRKLLNTLSVHFKVADADSTVAQLKERGIVTVEREHVIWK